MKSKPKEDISELYRLVNSEPEAVVANPIWRRLRSRDPAFLAKTPPAFRLGLLRHYYRKHKKNPWRLLAHAGEEEPAWPMWKGPIWEYESHREPNPDDSRCFRKLPLARGWAFEFYGVSSDICLRDDNEGEISGERYRLDRVLSLLFTNPKANPREELSEYEGALWIKTGTDLNFGGVWLYLPDEDASRPLRRPSERDRLELTFETSDEKLIARLSLKKNGMYVRRAAKTEIPRPLFATAVIDETRAGEGCLTCTWETDYYVPVDARLGEARSWTYEKHSLAAVDTMKETGIGELVDTAWTYRTIGDLEGAIARAIATQRAHRLFLPIYEAVLFGSSQ
jgi:hypothetical protein